MRPITAVFNGATNMKRDLYAEVSARIIAELERARRGALDQAMVGNRGPECAL